MWLSLTLAGREYRELVLATDQVESVRGTGYLEGPAGTRAIVRTKTGIEHAVTQTADHIATFLERRAEEPAAYGEKT